MDVPKFHMGGAIRERLVDLAGTLKAQWHADELRAAIFGNKPDAVRTLIAKGANPASLRMNGVAPIQHDDLYMPEYWNVLLALLDDPRVVATINHRSERSADHAIHAATRQYNVPALKFLLKHGANPNARGADGYTPLDIVTLALGRVLHTQDFSDVRYACLDKLLREGADPNAQIITTDQQGEITKASNTALHNVALTIPDKEIVMLVRRLLWSNADASLKSKAAGNGLQTAADILEIRAKRTHQNAGLIEALETLRAAENAAKPKPGTVPGAPQQS